jgi:hypothetical protein
MLWYATSHHYGAVLSPNAKTSGQGLTKPSRPRLLLERGCEAQERGGYASCGQRRAHGTQGMDIVSVHCIAYGVCVNESTGPWQTLCEVAFVPCGTTRRRPKSPHGEKRPNSAQHRNTSALILHRRITSVSEDNDVETRGLPAILQVYLGMQESRRGEQ